MSRERKLGSCRGTAYAEYFLAAAAMAGATMAVWSYMQSLNDTTYLSMRNGIMNQIDGPCSVDADGHIVGC